MFIIKYSVLGVKYNVFLNFLQISPIFALQIAYHRCFFVVSVTTAVSVKKYAVAVAIEQPGI